MTEQEIEERLKTLPYDVPSDIRPGAVSILMTAAGVVGQEAEEKFWENLRHLSLDDRENFFLAARKVGAGSASPRIERGEIQKMNRGPVAKVWEKVEALWRFLSDPNAPLAGKAIAIAALVYLVSPIDAIPDPIPLVGLTDDVGVLTLAFAKLATDLKKYLP